MRTLPLLLERLAALTTPLSLPLAARQHPPSRPHATALGYSVMTSYGNASPF